MNKEEKELFKKLYKPFPFDRVKFRVGQASYAKEKCVPFAYIDARDVTQRLNQIFGLSWHNRPTKTGACSVTIPFGGKLITRSDDAGETQVEAEKGKYSGAFKRAAVHFGVGLYLYYFPNVWVDANIYETGFGDKKKKNATLKMKDNNFLVNGKEVTAFLDWMDPEKWDEYADYFLDDRVEELSDITNEYKKQFTSWSNPAKSTSNNKAQSSEGDPDYSSYKITFGKYNGTLLKDLDDKNYIGYIIKNAKDPKQKEMFEKRLGEL